MDTNDNMSKVLEMLATLGDKVQTIDKSFQDEQTRKERDALVLEQKALAKEAAKEVVSALQEKLAKSDEDFSKFVQTHKDVLTTLSEEIRAETAARSDAEKNFKDLETRVSDIAQAVKSAGNKFIVGSVDNTLEVDAKTIETATNLVMLAWCKSIAEKTEYGVFDTDYGKRVKAVNDSSSIEVSSENYETIFSTDLQRQLEERLVVKNWFQELAMSSKLLTVPINPAYTYATWVDSTAYGTTASTGAEVEVTLTETTFRTYKLAAKSFITDETSEDAILALVPILVEHLAAAHAKSIEQMLLYGTGTNQPKGMSVLAADLGTDLTGGVAAPFTGDDVLLLRKELGNYGMKLNDLKLVVSQSVYWDLLDDDAYKEASYTGDTESQTRSGNVGRVYGIDVVVSDEANEGVGQVEAMLVYTPNYRIPRQRSFLTQTDYNVETQNRIIVNTQRLGFQPILDTDDTVSSWTRA